MDKPFTGRHMAVILVGAFAIILTVNVTMARLASSTFGGTVVDNSYVASQQFNTWLDQAEASRKLGWKVEPRRLPGGKLALRVTAVPPGATITAQARHTLGRQADRHLSFSPGPGGHFVSTSTLPSGRWTLQISVDADGKQWRGEARVQ